MDNLQRVQNTLKTSAHFDGRCGDDKVFMLFQLALCGHMTSEQQAKFLEDAKNRGLLNENGELIN